MQAIILAAGMGKRLKYLTKNSAKCMVKVNGIPLIQRMLLQLDEVQLSSITIVIGFEGNALKKYITSLHIKTPIHFIMNKEYYKTNNIHSLYLAKDFLTKEDTLLLESDLIFDSSLLRELLTNPYPSLALVDKYESWMDGTVVQLNQDHKITNFLSGKEFQFSEKDNYYKTVNIYKFSKEFSTTHYVPFLEAYSTALGNNEYYEQVLKVISLLEKPEIKALPITSGVWYEIDDIQDLNIAESIFANAKEKLSKMETRYGGYWRYPHLLDYCYLVNPFFPTPKLMEELTTNMEQVIRSYPSGLEVNNLLAAKYYDLSPRHICIGNGASELIKGLMELQTGKVGIIYPTFEEYAQRLSPDSIVPFYTKKHDFSYSAQELIQHFTKNIINTLVIINPDNPSGNYLRKNELLQLLSWTKEKGITFILDESFIDFATNGLEDTLLTSELLTANPHFVVIKSISKSYGIPGLRLGIVASSNHLFMDAIKKQVSIWNINSLGEYFMQIVEKYKDDYKQALLHFQEVRDNFVRELRTLKQLRVYDTQSNYVMCQVLDGFHAKKLTEMLLNRYDILIKDLSVKKGFEGGEYIRLAIKDEESNERLLFALRCLLK